MNDNWYIFRIPYHYGIVWDLFKGQSIINDTPLEYPTTVDFYGIFKEQPMNE